MQVATADFALPPLEAFTADDNNVRGPDATAYKTWGKQLRHKPYEQLRHKPYDPSQFHVSFCLNPYHTQTGHSKRLKACPKTHSGDRKLCNHVVSM